MTTDKDTSNAAVALAIKAAAIQQRNGCLDEATAALEEALALAPTHPVLLHNLGVLSALAGEPESAIGYFDKAIAEERHYASAHYNRGAAFQSMAMNAQAVKDFAAACAIDPEMYSARCALGFLWLAEGNRGRALDQFAYTYELRRGPERIGIEQKSLNFTTASKLRHDAEQFEFLSQSGGDGSRYKKLSMAYRSVADRWPPGMQRLSERDFEELGEDYNTAIASADAPELRGPAVAMRSDNAIISREFHNGGVAVVDHLLTAPALSRLQKYLWQSTIWHDFSHIEHFVASYLEDGLACPLLLQIVDELRARFSAELGQMPLIQAWAFKGLTQQSAVDTHADDAAVSINFWVTPNAANLTPERGGLCVCRAEPPADWAVKNYDADRGRVTEFIRAHASEVSVIPYSENRAVLFRSRLFHYSDAPHFASGYTNHRINLTLLFGNLSR